MTDATRTSSRCSWVSVTPQVNDAIDEMTPLTTIMLTACSDVEVLFLRRLRIRSRTTGSFSVALTLPALVRVAKPRKTSDRPEVARLAREEGKPPTSATAALGPTHQVAEYFQELKNGQRHPG
jgi:hypothetical protein